MKPDSEDIRQGRLNTFVAREVDSRNSRHDLSPLRPLKHGLLALPLLVPWVDTNNANHALSSDDFALLAAASYRCSYFHLCYLSRPEIETFSASDIHKFKFKLAHADSARPWRAPNTLF